MTSLTLVIAFLGILIARWQAGIATEKLRHDLYDRRFSIYLAFHTLLVAIVEKDDAEVELRAANAARAHAPFLLDIKVSTFLRELLAEAFRVHVEGQQLKIENIWSPSELSLRASKNAQDKLMIVSKVDALVAEFEPFIRLKDLSNLDVLAGTGSWVKLFLLHIRLSIRRLSFVLGFTENIPNDWQGKKRLAAEFGVPMSGLPYKGFEESILLAQNGAPLDERIREEIKRRRERMRRWGKPCSWATR